MEKGPHKFFCARVCEKKAFALAMKAAAKLELPAEPATARFTSVDGLVLEAKLLKQGEGDDAEYWAVLAASAGQPLPGEPKAGAKPLEQQVAELNAEIGPWAFKLSRYLAERLFWKQDELLKPVKAS